MNDYHCNTEINNLEKLDVKPNFKVWYKIKHIKNGNIYEIIKKTEAFYCSFRAQWYLENKPHGFNVQDVRIGGVIMRLKNGKALLEEYLDGKIDRIEELEEELLNCADFEVEPKKAVTFARWDEMTSVCKF